MCDVTINSSNVINVFSYVEIRYIDNKKELTFIFNNNNNKCLSLINISKLTSLTLRSTG